MNPQGKMFDQWCREIGVGRTTAYHWRELQINGEPMLQVSSNIMGRLFITAEQDARFWARANAGEFKKEFHGVASRGIPINTKRKEL